MYGPFDLRGAIAAKMTFWTWSFTEPRYDTCMFAASTDGDSFGGRALSGKWDYWTQQELDLSDVPYKGNLLGQERVWIAFWFKSDSTIQHLHGWYVDDVSVTTDPSIVC
jgi:hypothetical protein